MGLTEEQKAIMKARITGREVIRIKAYAGTGKTFILEQLAKRFEAEFTKSKVLYLAYNKDICVEAKSRFPKNVTCMTTHGLAYSRIGKKYMAAGKLYNTSKLQFKRAVEDWFIYIRESVDIDKLPHVVAKWLGSYDKEYLSWNDSNAAQGTLSNYFNSAQSKIDVDMHIPPERKLKLGVPMKGLEMMCKHIWERMQDFEDKKVPMSHDGYLKLYDLEKEDLGKQYSIIMFDEAQDAAGAQINIVKRAKACKIVVGDAHQSLYRFRGAVNALSKFTATQDYKLSTSFRFGPTVAAWATSILGTWKNETTPVTSMKTEDSVVFDYQVEHGRRPYAYLCRTNAEMFGKAVQCLRDDITFSFLGGFPAKLKSDITDTYHLRIGTPDLIKNPILRKRNFGELIRYAHMSEDIEVSKLIGLVNTYEDAIPTILEDIERHNLPAHRNAEVTLVTAHRSKGLEWDQVVLAPDFLNAFCREMKQEEILQAETLPVNIDTLTKEDDANLLYVAMTRSRKVTGAPKKLLDLINNAGKLKMELQQ